MAANPPLSKISSNIDKLERTFNRLQAAQRRQLKNEDIVRIEKDGIVSFERVRTTAVESASGQSNARTEDLTPVSTTPTPSLSEGPPSEIPANSNLLPHKLPETPHAPENGNLIGSSGAPLASEPSTDSSPQPLAASPLSAEADDAGRASATPPADAISCHEPQNSDNQLATPVPPTSKTRQRDSGDDSNSRDPLEELLHRAIALTKVRRGRPPAFDDTSKGQLVALLAVGMSMRQAAAVLGVSHTTIQKTLKADPSLGEDIVSARFQAQLHPLACVIREARRSWKAATWLLKYLDSKIASHEETPDERKDRQQRETDEFFAHASSRNVKKRIIKS